MSNNHTTCDPERIELFLQVGFLDERFGQGAYEDDDYCIRILARVNMKDAPRMHPVNTKARAAPGHPVRHGSVKASAIKAK